MAGRGCWTLDRRCHYPLTHEKPMAVVVLLCSPETAVRVEAITRGAHKVCLWVRIPRTGACWGELRLDTHVMLGLCWSSISFG